MTTTVCFILDASVTLSWCFPDESNKHCDDILAHLESANAIAPQIWTVEVPNALLVAERRGRITRANAQRFLHLLQSLPVQIVKEPLDMIELLNLARDTRLSSYDACYLALALRESIAIATIDTRLAEAATSLGLTVL